MKQIILLILLIGTSFFLRAQDLRITEIMYNPDNADGAWEWIEVYNAGADLIDLTGFVIDDNSGASYSEANIPSGSIAPGKSAILFNASRLSESEFLEVWGTVDLISVSRWSSLNNSGDSIGIWSSFEAYSGDNASQENTIEQVSYAADGEIWPEDDGSASIYLTDLDADNSDGTNWSLSSSGTVTPIFTAYASIASEIADGQDIGSPGLEGSVETDTEKPLITCPENVDMAADIDNCGSTFSFLIPTGTDNVTEELLFQGLRDDGLELTDVYPIGLTTITWTAIDEAGNVSEPCDQLILITDNVAPEIVCSDDVEVLSEDGNPVQVAIELATASNVCEGSITISALRSDEKELNEPFVVGETTITWQAIDESDNVAECIQIITVNFNASNENAITTFAIPEQLEDAVIDTENKTILLKVPFGTAVDSLVPNIVISEEASSNPESGVVQDFTNPVAYTVTAQDGSEQVWMVTVEIEEEEMMNDLLVNSFMLVNADTDEDLFLLEEGMMIAIEDLPTLHLDIRANTNDAVESVRLSLAGAQSTERTESLIPYALFQDLPIGDYKGNDFIIGAYTVSATPYAENSLRGEMGNPLAVNFEIVGSTDTLAITSYTLVNADTNEDLFVITDGMIIAVNELPTLHLDIRANTTDDVESVKLALSGTQTSGRTESLHPFALFQDLPIGDYKGNDFITGAYTVIGVPFSEDNARGSLGSSYRVDFELVDTSLQIIDFTLVNAETDEDLFDITEGMVIDLADLPTTHLDIRVNTSDNVGSVRISLEGAITSARTESLVPYALFQDLPIGDYKGNELIVGQYAVSAKPYSENSLRGSMGMVKTINFELVGALETVGGNSLTVFPNPASTFTNIRFETPVDMAEIQIYDFSGRLVETYAIETQQQKKKYELIVSGLEPSNYIIRMKDKQGNFYQEQLIVSE